MTQIALDSIESKILAEVISDHRTRQVFAEYYGVTLLRKLERELGIPIPTDNRQP